jgi:hypothetical protein
LSAIGRIERSTVLLSISMRPRKRERPSQRESVADCLGELDLLTDQPELFAQSRFKIGDNSAAIFLTHRTAFIGRSAADIVLDLEVGDCLSAWPAIGEFQAYNRLPTVPA